MESKKYQVTDGTAAVLSCIEELNDLCGRFRDAVSITYGEVQTDNVIDICAERFGILRDEMYRVLGDIIQEHLTDTENKNQI